MSYMEYTRLERRRSCLQDDISKYEDLKKKWENSFQPTFLSSALRKGLLWGVIWYVLLQIGLGLILFFPLIFVRGFTQGAFNFLSLVVAFGIGALIAIFHYRDEKDDYEFYTKTNISELKKELAYLTDYTERYANEHKKEILAGAQATRQMEAERQAVLRDLERKKEADRIRELKEEEVAILRKIRDDLKD